VGEGTPAEETFIGNTFGSGRGTSLDNQGEGVQGKIGSKEEATRKSLEGGKMRVKGVREHPLDRSYHYWEKRKAEGVEEGEAIRRVGPGQTFLGQRRAKLNRDGGESLKKMRTLEGGGT